MNDGCKGCSGDRSLHAYCGPLGWSVSQEVSQGTWWELARFVHACFVGETDTIRIILTIDIVKIILSFMVSLGRVSLHRCTYMFTRGPRAHICIRSGRIGVVLPCRSCEPPILACILESWDHCQ